MELLYRLEAQLTEIVPDRCRAGGRTDEVH